MTDSAERAGEGRDVAQFCRRPHLHHRRTTRQARIANAVHAVRRLGDAVLLAEVRRLHHQLLHRAVKSTGYHSRGLDKLGRWYGAHIRRLRERVASRVEVRVLSEGKNTLQTYPPIPSDPAFSRYRTRHFLGSISTKFWRILVFYLVHIGSYLHVKILFNWCHKGFYNACSFWPLFDQKIPLQYHKKYPPTRHFHDF